MQGVFYPKNPKKYIGKNIGKIIYRSSWEWHFMTTCDTHPYITQWASESISIKYKHPLKNKWASYVPDFFVAYIDKNMKQHVEILEIKPMTQVPINMSGFQGKVSKNDKLVQIVNNAKFSAALLYCAKRGWKFRIATAEQLFAFKRGK